MAKDINAWLEKKIQHLWNGQTNVCPSLRLCHIIYTFEPNNTPYGITLHIYRFQKIRVSTSYAISDLVFQVSRWITNNTPIWHAAVYLNHVCKPSFYLLRIGVQQVDILHGSLHLASWILGMMQSKFVCLICTPANDRTLLAAIYIATTAFLTPVGPTRKWHWHTSIYRWCTY
jgi:hypothetical protein